MSNNRHLIDIYKAIYKLDGIREPFDNFGPDHPKIGDKVKPGDYFSYNFIYKLDKVPWDSKLTKEEVLGNTWICTRISHRDYHLYISFQSVNKINGRRRTIKFQDEYNLTCEIIDMPEKAKLIIDYKNGKYTLVELLNIFKEKNYDSRIHFNSIFLDMNGNEYLQVIEEIEKEK